VSEKRRESLAAKIDKAYQQMLVPFPSRDIMKVADSTERGWDLSGDLNLYWSNIAGYSSWARVMHERPVERLIEARRSLSQDFFEAHPHHQVLRDRITWDDTPDLMRELTLYEDTRLTLIELLDYLLEQRKEQDKPADV
jgi:hypothetical protein